jgi:hypothetical protein
MIFHHTIFASLPINDGYVLMSYVSRNGRKNEVDHPTNYIARHIQIYVENTSIRRENHRHQPYGMFTITTGIRLLYK